MGLITNDKIHSNVFHTQIKRIRLFSFFLFMTVCALNDTEGCGKNGKWFTKVLLNLILEQSTSTRGRVELELNTQPGVISSSPGANKPEQQYTANLDNKSTVNPQNDVKLYYDFANNISTKLKL